MNQLYDAIGISKQAAHKYAVAQQGYDHKLVTLAKQAEDLRKAHPGCGVEKMYYALKPDFLGRDRFVSEFMALGFRLKRAKNYRRTTISSLIYRPNLIQGLQVSAPSKVWQSDITYIGIGDRHYYATFIIDVYSKEIVGYEVSDHMRARANIKALKMALKHRAAPEIHHSDRGSQYISRDYVSLLESNGCKVSMGLIAQDNAYAERINRTIKEEYLDHWNITTFDQLRKCIGRAVRNYNTKRPHLHLDMLSPQEFIKKWQTISDNQKPVITIFEPEIFI